MSTHTPRANVFASASETNMFIFIVVPWSTSRHRFKRTLVRHRHYNHLASSGFSFLGQPLLQWVISKIQTLCLRLCVTAPAPFLSITVLKCLQSITPQIPNCDSRGEAAGAAGGDRSWQDSVCVCVCVWVYLVCRSSNLITKGLCWHVSFSDHLEQQC